MLKLFNTLTKKRSLFSPREQHSVKMYTCGPSVYNFVHIGNFRTFYWEDVLKRTLLTLGYRVIHAMPISDIEDKSVKAFFSQTEFSDITKFLKPRINAFLNDWQRLNLLKPDFLISFSESVTLVEKWIIHALENKYAYTDARGNVILDISKTGYGALYKINTKNRGIRIQDDYAKNGYYSFAIWKAKKRKDIYFNPEKLVPGRPASHIYCAVIANEYLGSPIDIHCGGTDNIYPHHENEIALANTRYSRIFANYWFHVAHLTVNKRKMSKRLGNIVYLRDIIEKGFTPEELKYFYLKTHYRKTQNFDYQLLEKAGRELKEIRSLAKEYVGKDDLFSVDEIYRSNIARIVFDDLKIHTALKKTLKNLHELTRSRSNKQSIAILKDLKLLERITGIEFLPKT